MKNKLLHRNCESKRSAENSQSKKRGRSLSKFIVALAMIIVSGLSLQSFAQTVLINPTQEGGFELGNSFAANGWSVANMPANPWIVGPLSNGAITGNAAFISNNGTTPSYDLAGTSTNYFWRDVTVPAGQSKIQLTFNWISNGEASWDLWQVFAAPTSITPVASVHSGSSGTTNVPAAINGATFIGFGQSQTTVQTATFFLPANLAGTTFRLIFVWKSDTSFGTQPPAQIDNISLTSSVPGNFISIVSGNWTSPSTWDANAVPSPADNATVAIGHTVTLDAANQAINDLIVRGTFNYGATPTAFNVNGNLTVNSGGAVNVFTGTTGKTLTVTGNIQNDGVIDISVGTGTAGNLTLNGAAVQNVTGTGTWGTAGVIRNITFANTNTAIPNINWGMNVIVANNLNMTGARVNLGTSKLTFGNNAAGGTLTAPVGTGFLPGGKFSRWWTATATGTSVSAGLDPTNTTSRYPFVTATGVDRSAYISRTSSAGAVAGELAMVYQHANTMTTGLSIADGAYTVTDRYDGNWTISTEGTPVSATSYTVVLLAPQAYIPSNGNSRIIGASAAIGGTHQNGTVTPGAQRITIPQADLLAGPLYIGVAASDIPFVSVASGEWTNASIWNKGTVPTCTDPVAINTGHEVVINSAGNSALSMNVATGGTLKVESGNLTIGCTNNNNQFTNSGTLNVTGGTLTINGQLLSSTNSTFSQSGGEIIVDGNNNGDAATSVASGTGIVQLNTNLLNWTGGTLTIVDPHANSTASNSFAYSSSSSVNITGAHTVKLGDGVSTQPGGNATNGFRINTFASSGRITFANLTIDGLAGTNRYVTTTYEFGVNNTLTITPTSHMNLGLQLNLAGNFVNNGKFTSTSSVRLGTFLNGTFAATTVEQTISGTGIFENNATTPTASFNNLTVNNTSVEGVNINTPISISGTLTLTNGFVNTTTANTFQIGTATAGGTIVGMSDTRYIRGPISRTIGSSNNTYVLFPVGKTNYAPIWLNPATTDVSVYRAETFESNSGTANPSIVSLSAVRRWEAPRVSGTAVPVGVRIGDANLKADTIVVQAPSANGEYTNAFGSTATFAAGTPNTVQGTLSADPYTGFISYAVSNICSGAPIVGNTTATANDICFGQPVTVGLQFIPAGTGISYQWLYSDDNVTYDTIVNATNFNYTTTPTVEGFYKALVTCANSGLTSNSTPINIQFVNDAPVITDATRCGPGTVTLTTTAATGATVKWYETATANQSIADGNSFTTPVLNASRNYYAANVIETPVTGAIGAGASTNSSAGQSFLPGFWGGAKTQYIIRASELTAAGFSAGNFTSLGFEPTTSGQTYQGFTVEMGNTASTTAPTTTFLSGLTKVYEGTGVDNAFTPVANTVNNLALGTGNGAQTFTWDGSSNIVVSISWSLVPGASTSTASTMKVDNVGYTATAYRQRDNVTPAAMLAETSVSSTTQIRPRFLINGIGICSSPREEVSVTVTPAPAFAVSASALTVCSTSPSSAVTVTTGAADYTSYTWTPSATVSGDAATGWTFAPAVTTSYEVVASGPGGCQNRDTIVVTATPLPNLLTVANSAVSACDGVTTLPIAANATLASVSPFTQTVALGTATSLASNGSATLTATIPALPAGAVVTGTKLVFNGVTTAGGNWPSDIDVTMSGASTLATVTIASVNSTVTNAGPYERSASLISAQGGSVTVQFENNYSGTTTIASTSLVINYTLPDPANITWWTAATGGTQLSTSATFETIGSSVIPTGVPGTYNFYAQADNQGCAKTPRELVVVTINPISLNPVLSADQAICAGGTTPTFSATIPTGTLGTVTWYSNAGLTAQVHQGATFTPAVTAPGVYKYYANHDNTSCVSGADSVTFTIFANPTAPIISAANGFEICEGDELTLVSDVETGIVWSANAQTNDSIVTTQAGIYTVTVTDVNNCSTTSAPVTVIVNALPTVNAGNDFAVCQNGQAILSASGASTYQWDNNVTNNASFVVIETTTYTVTGTDANGCQNTDQVTITTNALPTVDAGSNITQCGDQTVTLTATGATVYSWNNNVTNGTAFDAPFGTSVYLVTGVDANGCANTDAVTVTIYEDPTATISVVSGVTLQASPANASYQWINCADNSPIVGATSSVFTPTENGSYAVIVTGMGGCENTSACFNVTSVGLDQMELNNTIQLYPNPTTGEVFVNMTSDINAAVVVMDAQGKVVLTQNGVSNGSTIQLGNFENGVYMIQVNSEVGAKVFRIVKN